MCPETALAGNEGVNCLNQFFRQEWFVEDRVRLRVMLMDSVHINFSTVKNGAEIWMRLPATNHQIHPIEWLHDEVGDKQIGLRFGSLKCFKRVERRCEQARVEAFHREERADDFADHGLVIDDKDSRLPRGGDGFDSFGFSGSDVLHCLLTM